ncbi:MAG: hypothetical protein Q8P84_04655 [Deltaproteobacteria bacterium]|nr:hypothetical protein [Deltaproteobacteria bacterium]
MNSGELKIADCLTNCHKPNSVQISRDDGEMLLGWICSESLVDEVVKLADQLKKGTTPLKPSTALKEKLIEIHPVTKWDG